MNRYLVSAGAGGQHAGANNSIVLGGIHHLATYFTMV